MIYFTLLSHQPLLYLSVNVAFDLIHVVTLLGLFLSLLILLIEVFNDQDVLCLHESFLSSCLVDSLVLCPVCLLICPSRFPSRYFLRDISFEAEAARSR